MKRSTLTRSLTAGFMFFIIAVPGLAQDTYSEPSFGSGNTMNPSDAADNSDFGLGGWPENETSSSEPGPSFGNTPCVSCGEEVGLKYYQGVNGCTCRSKLCEPTWHSDTRTIPWEAFAYGEYIGPHRTPHVPVYRLRVDDQIEFVYRITREQAFQPYRLMVGDRIRIDSSTDNDLNQGGQDGLQILSDGSISLRLIGRVMAARKT
ncbi:MAG: polysaccharide biosynthesis/export family protein, partial [Pirellulaceae bacterium]|nr:polysaccharide biosynthesis/export family protein [Pirellulaceae bacterium]